MAKKTAKLEVNSFVRGLITEASVLNFPDNASADEINFVLNRDGSRDRRFGIGFENNYELITSPVAYNVLIGQPTTFQWDNVGGASGRSFLVVQINNILSFYDLAVPSLSDGGSVGQITLTSIVSLNGEYSFASVNGNLVVVAGTGDIGIVSYSSGGFSVSYGRIKVRDLWGVEFAPTQDNPTFRPAAEPPDHFYNLRNQGWIVPRRNSRTNVNLYIDPIQAYRQEISLNPADSDKVWTALQFQATTATDPPFEMIWPKLWKESFMTQSTVSKGAFIIDLLNRGLSRSEQIDEINSTYPELTVLPTYTARADRTVDGASVICEFAGRIFYAGFSGEVVDGDNRSPNLSNQIAFSALVKSTADITKCYQDGDPTSREENDLIDTDGGLIPILGADGIINMINIGQHLIVFSRNGVWAISGGGDYGFTATNYKVTKITPFGLLGKHSVIESTGSVFYWSTDGIYVIGQDQVGGFSAKNITEATIQSLYENIPAESKSKVFGTYDLIGKKLRWIYKTGSAFSNASVTYELVLDTVLQAFSLFKIGTLAGSTKPEIYSCFKSSISGALSDQILVFSGPDDVYVNSDPVVIGAESRGSVVQSTRYLVFTYNGATLNYTFADYNNEAFLDWQEVDGVGVDATGYLITGTVTGGDSSVAKQVPFLTLHFVRTETGFNPDFSLENPSGCLVSCQWDFSNSPNSLKWSTPFQGYRYRKFYMPLNVNDPFDTGFEVITTRNKVRGRGRAFAFRMETEPGKDCRILGWNINVTGNSAT